MNELYLLTALTHLHPGSGETGYGVVDKTVQRDPIEGLPVIHSSSLKGAFREQIEEKLPPKMDSQGEKIKDDPLVEHIFGTSIEVTRNSSKKNANRNAGQYRFHQAFLLSMPVRSNVAPFFQATSPKILKQLLAQIDLLNISVPTEVLEALTALSNISAEVGTPKIFTGHDEVWLEEFKAERGEIEAIYIGTLADLIGTHIAIFDHGDLKQLCANLPIIARNYLENGISQNLWYEEIVPRESRFTFVLQTQAFSGNSSGLTDLKEIVTQKLGSKVQVGANASVGYGLCQVTSIQ